MGLIDNFGRVASMYMEEKENLQKAEEKRKRTCYRTRILAA